MSFIGCSICSYTGPICLFFRRMQEAYLCSASACGRWHYGLVINPFACNGCVWLKDEEAYISCRRRWEVSFLLVSNNLNFRYNHNHRHFER